jgi:protein-tyrosine phosphatase
VDRVVPFSTVFNFRDLGGYRTADGRTVRWRRLFRADGLFRLTEDDLTGFAALGIRTVLDLRRPDELAADGRIADELGIDYRHVNLNVNPWPPTELTPEQLPGYLAERYMIMAEEALESGAPMGTALRLIAEAQAAPLVFHCAAGKDRTGVLAALTLALLGVPDDDIADDYALSGESERRYYAWARRARRRAAAGAEPPDAGLPHAGLTGVGPPDAGLPDREPTDGGRSGGSGAAGVEEPEEAGHVWAWLRDPAPREAMLLFLAELRRRYGSVRSYTEGAGITDEHVAAMGEHLLDGA